MTDTARLLNDAMAAATDGARLPYIDARVIFEDGRELMAHADQRDMARARVAVGVQPDTDDPLGMLVFTRACAWSYLTRTSEISMGWADFDATVPFVLEQRPGEPPTTADPTEPVTAG